MTDVAVIGLESSTMQIHWWDSRKGQLADGRRLPPGTHLKLRSEHHLDPPLGYVISELVPKLFWRWTGTKERRVTRVDRAPDPVTPLNSVYWSAEDWPLADPKKQTGQSIFRAAIEGSTRGQFPIEAAIVTSAYLYIRGVTRDRSGGVSVKPSMPVGPSVQIGEVYTKSTATSRYEAAAPVDPRVEISLLQGSALFDHLKIQSMDFVESSGGARRSPFIDVLGALTDQYFFADAVPTPAKPVPAQLTPGVPISIEVGIPTSDGLRTAFAVMVRDLENERQSVTPPTFLTEVEGRIVATDLPTKLLSDTSTRVLRALAKVGGNVEYLSARMERPVRWVWDQTVSALRELGAASVDDAIALVTHETAGADEWYRPVAEARFADVLYDLEPLFTEPAETRADIEWVRTSAATLAALKAKQSDRLADLGWREEALDAINDAVAISRGLAVVPLKPRLAKKRAAKPVKRRKKGAGAAKPVKRRTKAAGAAKPVKRRKKGAGAAKPVKRRKKGAGAAKPVKRRRRMSQSR